MASRTFLRTGEVPALYGLDARRSEWALWNTLSKGEDTGMGDYGRWQSRLAVPIMQGIAEDHGINVQTAVDPHTSTCPAIMPPRCWRVAPSMLTDGRDAVLVVVQRTEAAMREWKEPFAMPEKSRLRHQAIAAAHDVGEVLIGVLVDGYSSKLFRVSADEARRAEIRRRCELFVQDVIDGIEPDIDFGADERAIRKGDAVKKVEAVAGDVQSLVDERRKLEGERAPADAKLKGIEARIRQIDTNLIHIAGATGKIDVATCLVVVDRDARGNPKVKVVDKQAAPLF